MSEESPSENTEAGWIITACRSCGREIKLRASVSLSELACPYCSEMLGGGAGDAAEGAPDPAGRTAGAPPPGETWETPDPATGKHVRRSPSAPKPEEPEWDRDPDEVTETEDGDTTDFLEVDPDDPNAVRIRRVRRKQTLTRGQKIARGIGLVGGGIVAIACLTLIVIALARGTGTVSRDIRKIAELPDEVKELIAAAKPEGGKIPEVLTEAETKAALKIILGYLEADGWEAKVPYVYQPERARARMERWYSRAENSDAPIKKRNVELKARVARRAKVVEGENERFIIKIAFETLPGLYKIFALRQTPDDIKLHWESSVGYQRMPLKEFLQNPPPGPVPFRALLKPAGYFAFDYSDSSKYRCFQITYPGDIDFNLYGYIERGDDQLNQTLNNALMSYVVSLQATPDEGSRKQVRIVDVLEESWFE